MTLKFLIDECLSPELARMAIEAGYPESTCVRNRGLQGIKDWDLIEHAVANDFTLVTNNSVDFRGAGVGKPGGLYALQPIHAGLVCLNSCHGLDLDLQKLLFGYALEVIARQPDLVDLALEISETDGHDIDIIEYEIRAGR